MTPPQPLLSPLEEVWQTLYGSPYEFGKDALFLFDNEADDQLDINALRFLDPDGSHDLRDVGDCEILFEQPVEGFDPEVAEFTDLTAPDPYWSEASMMLVSAAIEVEDGDGETHYLSGYIAEIVMNFTIPQGCYVLINEFIPTGIHTSADAAVITATTFADVDAGRTIDEPTSCSDNYWACRDEAEYQRDIEKAGLGTPWEGMGFGAAAGGAVGSGSGTFIGSFFGGAGAVPGGAIGLVIGIAGGAITGGVVQYTEEYNAIGRRFITRLKKCDRCYDTCLTSGEWPSYCDSL